MLKDNEKQGLFCSSSIDGLFIISKKKVHNFFILLQSSALIIPIASFFPILENEKNDFIFPFAGWTFSRFSQGATASKNTFKSKK